ncbi:MAG: hypothetical protein F6K18_15615 [Okeania sp. SIO2C2]|uniref:hypothetical protein n=1 Tax=Okeania sp. SIO2C2 TaxID=2607787 RepID=UPI0013B8F7F7|nr:hypothetical protein [Okeania sp. SIO2C2]NEP88144.1 hypothetical protein [Okeania sp. SIO2C2]
MNQSNSSSSIKRFPCPSCGAKVSFNPEVAQLKCEYCGWEDVIPDSDEQIQEQSYEQYLNQSNAKLATLSEIALEVSCNNCGATVEFEPPQIAGECAFCGSNIVASPTSSDPTILPEGLIPFTIGRKKAREEVQSWINKLWFAPNALKKLAQMEKIKGIYLPFWTYDAYTATNYRGQRGVYYYTTETYTENQETKTRTVRHTMWYSASGQVSRFFDDILISATFSVDKKRLDALEPWHLNKSLRPYESSFLAGFEAQKPQVSLKDGFEEAKRVMDVKIRSDIRRDIGGDEQNINHSSTSYSAITFKHILLPVYLTAYRYQNKTYQVMVNACTGEVQGDRPYSILKITFTILFALAMVAIVITLVIKFN